MAMQLLSSGFKHQGDIPVQYTCEGDDISPALSWSGIPRQTQSLVLVVDDPDAPDPAAPRTVWCHWLLYNMPALTHGLPESVALDALPQGTLSGKNDWQRVGYGGPCPPIGRHRYFFKLFALNTVLPDLKLPTKAQLELAIEGHVIGQAELIGFYQKSH